jgi:hypothetical protein
MCATSTVPTGGPARCGRGAIAPRRSTARPTSSPAAATSSSIRFAPVWPYGRPSARVSLVELSRPYAQGATDQLLTGHELYDRLARTLAERQKQYRALFRTALDAEFVDSSRAATNGGWAIGNAGFKQQIAKALGRRVALLPRGRPRKAKAKRRQLSLL